MNALKILLWQSMLGAYLALVLLSWPLLVALWKWMFLTTWKQAHRQSWARWNQIRRDWRELPA